MFVYFCIRKKYVQNPASGAVEMPLSKALIMHENFFWLIYNQQACDDWPENSINKEGG